MTSYGLTPYDKTEVNGSRPLAPIFFKKYMVLFKIRTPKILPQVVKSDDVYP
jgi:hypothetical protein